MKFAVAAIVFVLAFAASAARAADEPEAVYQKWHRAAVTGNVEEMLRYAPDTQRAEIAAMPPGQKEGVMKLIAALMPRAFLLRSKNVDPGGGNARLIVSGPGQPIVGEKPEMLFGSIRMVMERGEWRVAEANWSNIQPASLPAAAPAPRAGPAAPAAPAAPAPAAPRKAAIPSRAAPAIGTMNSAPERKLGAEKPPCVFKPVMTAEDMENCR